MSRRLPTVTTINGRMVTVERAKVSVFDNALLYAEGLFETMLAIDKRIVLLDEHLDRLWGGAKVIGLTIPVERARLTHWMERTVGAHRSRIKKLRLTISSGEAERWVGRQGKPQVILSASPHEMPTRPFNLLVSDLLIDQDSVFRRIKTISYAIHAAALKRAKAKDFDDALLLNRNREVAEVTSANIFWIKKQRIFTPPLAAGCLEGVTRKVVIDCAKSLGLNVTESTDRLSGVLKAEEVFITSSLKLVVSVQKIHSDDRTYSYQPGPITKLIANQLCSQLIG